MSNESNQDNDPVTEKLKTSWYKVAQYTAVFMAVVIVGGAFVYKATSKDRLLVAMSSQAAKGKLMFSNNPVPFQTDQCATYIVELAPAKSDPKVKDRIRGSKATSFSKKVRSQSDKLINKYGGKKRADLSVSLKGFIVECLSREQALRFSFDPAVRSIEQDGQVYGTAMQENQNDGRWSVALDRIDQRDRPLDGKYYYDDAAGSGVNIYILDSGVRTTHEELAGRAFVGADFVLVPKLDENGNPVKDENGNVINVPDGYNGQDCYGHGTPIASIAAGTRYGVAKAAKVHSVRVIKCDGQATYGVGDKSTVLLGIEWITANAVKPAVANYSLSPYDFSTAAYPSKFYTAFRNSIDSGVHWVISAGNDANAIDVCNSVPHGFSDTLTVGAMYVGSSNDTYAYGSNKGSCVDVYAPSCNISASHASDIATGTPCGTSNATPYAVGVAALMLSKDPSMSPSALVQAIKNSATPGKLVMEGGATPPYGTNNLLLYSSPPPVAPPCSFVKPTLSSTAASQTGSPGTPKSYAVTLKNNDSSNCPASTYNLSSATVPIGWTVSPINANLTVSPGGQAMQSFTITPSNSASTANHQVVIKAEKSGMANAIFDTISLYYNIPAPSPTCTTTNPTLTLSPASGQEQKGSALTFNYILKNNDQSNCGNSTFTVTSINLPTGWSMTPSQVNEPLAPGAQVTKQISITSSASASSGPHGVTLRAANSTNSSKSSEATYTYSISDPIVVSGTIKGPSGEPLRNVIMSLTGPNGNVLRSYTNSLGQFQFTNVPTGVTYSLTANSRRYRFEPQQITVNASVTNINLVGME